MYQIIVSGSTYTTSIRGRLIIEYKEALHKYIKMCMREADYASIIPVKNTVTLVKSDTMEIIRQMNIHTFVAKTLSPLKKNKSKPVIFK